MKKGPTANAKVPPVLNTDMDMAAFYRKWLQDVADAQSPGGGFPDAGLVRITCAQQSRAVEALKRLLACAHRHGIDFVPGIWDHIYRGGVQGGGPKELAENARRKTPGLVWGLTTDNLMDYSVAALRTGVSGPPR